jgi:hypothetical protein
VAVSQSDIRKLAEMSRLRGVEFFKFGLNAEMLEKIMSLG